MSFLTVLKKELLAIPGWRTSRKIVVIESDDWGSIRMPSQEAFDLLSAKGIDLTTGDSKRYNLYDTLASAADLDSLFSVLKRFKDKNGNHPVITALSLVANPDFDKIRENHFQQYYYESVVETLKRYYPQQDVFTYWRQGISEKLFMPQFHGREHLNVAAWMHALQRNDSSTKAAFDQGIWGFNNALPLEVSYQAAFDLESLDDLKQHEEIIQDGLSMFEKLFGYKATFFVAPNGILHEQLYPATRRMGIDFLYSAKLHPVPVRPGKFKKRFNYLGKKSVADQRFITRNAFFEPSQYNLNCVQQCLNEIELAFRFKKPSIISSHRVNYIGQHVVKNREHGLRQLELLLTSIMSRWPDVEFMSSDALGRLMQTTHAN